MLAYNLTWSTRAVKQPVIKYGLKLTLSFTLFPTNLMSVCILDLCAAEVLHVFGDEREQSEMYKIKPG